MDKYIIVKMKSFEKLERFQLRINEQSRKGYKTINLTSGSGGVFALMEKMV